MEQNTSTMPKSVDNAPEYIRKRFATAQQAQPNTEEPQPEQPTAEQTPTSNEPEPTQTVEQEDNDAKAWKGRLTKEQEQHRQTTSQLEAEKLARQQAEKQAQKAEADRQALAQRLAELEQSKAQPQTEPQPTAEPFSEEELAEIEQVMGLSGQKLATFIRQQQAQPPAQDVGKIVDERLSQAKEQTALEQRQTEWRHAVSKDIPEIQGLLTDPKFMEYAQNKQVDFYGNTAVTLINTAGQTLDVSLIPKIRTLIDEYQQAQQPPKEAVTAPPNKGGNTVTSQPSAKPKMSAKEEAYAKSLAREGKTKELKAYLAKFNPH